MDEEEYNTKYINLRILKSIQEYLKSEDNSPTSVFPINVPEDLLLQILKFNGPESSDRLIHHIFKLGLTLWSEKLFAETFGSRRTLEEFIVLLKKRNTEI